MSKEINENKINLFVEPSQELEKRVEQLTNELVKSEDKFCNMVENYNDVLWEADLSLRVTYVTPNVYKLLGFTSEEMVSGNMTAFDFMRPEEAQRVASIIKPKILAQEPLVNHECTLIHRDGHEVFTESSGRPMHDSKGNLIGWRGIDRDITERKKAEALNNALNSINSALNSSLDFNETMQRMMNISAKAMECDSSLLVMQLDDDWTIQHVTGLSKDLIGRKVSSETKPFIFEAMQNKPILIRDVENDERIISNGEFGQGSLIIVPLIIKEKIIGGISFNYLKKQVDFREAQVDFVKKLSASAALALENSRLYAEQLRISNTLQKSFIIMPESIDSANFGHFYHSSTMMVSVGGDFYDLFELADNKLGIIIGDVSGKGLKAANLTAIAKNTIKAYAYYESSPAVVLEKANAVLRNASTIPEMFATVFFGILEKQTGKLLYCNGGHPPGIIKRRKSSEALSISTNCPPLGIFEKGEFEHFDITYVDNATTMEKGDILILYTDGVVEARLGKELFELDGLMNYVSKLDQTTAQEIPHKIYNKLLSFTRGKLMDDIAILALSLK